MSVPASWPRTSSSADIRSYRTRTSLLVCGLWVIITVFWMVMEGRSGVTGLLQVLPIVLAAGVAMAALFARPCVRVSQDEVAVLGVVRDVRMAYPALREVSERFSLTLIDQSGQAFPAWALPVQRKTQRTDVTVDRMRRPAGPGDDDWQPRDLGRYEPGAARLDILARWRTALRSGASSGPERAVVTVAWLLPAAFAVCVVAAVLVAVL